MLSVDTAPQEFKETQQSPVILDLCLREPQSEKSHDYRDYIVFEKLRFQNVFRPLENEKLVFSNSSGLKTVFQKLRFREILVGTVALTAAFSNFFSIACRLPNCVIELVFVSQKVKFVACASFKI